MRRLAPLSSDLCATFFHLLYLLSPYISERSISNQTLAQCIRTAYSAYNMIIGASVDFVQGRDDCRNEMLAHQHFSGALGWLTLDKIVK